MAAKWPAMGAIVRKPYFRYGQSARGFGGTFVVFS